jgi:hypothetical protein
MKRNTLLIDADDTLWENNVFFEKLIEDFITLVEPCGYSRAYIRHILNETERKNIRQYGYGVRSFGRSLEETYMKLADQMAKRETLAQIHVRVVELERTPPKILDGVPETLAYLTARVDPVHQRGACGAGGEGGALRPAGIFRSHRNRRRKRRQDLPGAGEQAQNREDARLDDRQQPA